jgi:hypothetical protein
MQTSSTLSIGRRQTRPTVPAQFVRSHLFYLSCAPNQDPHSVQSNQRLLRCLLPIRSASKVLKPDGEIQIILKNGERYERWNLPALLDKDAGLQLQSSHPLDKTMFPGYKHRLTNGMQGAIQEVPDKKGGRVYVFGCSGSKDTSAKDTHPAMLAGRFLTIVQSPVPKGWTDDDLWTEVFAMLESFCAPSNVLEIRRKLDPTPETRQLNRVIYAMERSAVVKRTPPSSSSKSQTPRLSPTC